MWQYKPFPSSVLVPSSPHMIVHLECLENCWHPSSWWFCCIFPRDLFLQCQGYGRGFIQITSYMLYIKWSEIDLKKWSRHWWIYKDDLLLWGLKSRLCMGLLMTSMVGWMLYSHAWFWMVSAAVTSVEL